MITVFKYRIEPGETILHMPKGAGLLHFDFVPKDRAWFVWALVDTRRPDEIRTLRMYGTGHEIQTYGVYIGTAISLQGFVAHLFEVAKTDA